MIIWKKDKLIRNIIKFLQIINNKLDKIKLGFQRIM